MESLRKILTGQVIEPDDSAYDQARRVWNGSIDRYPAVFRLNQNIRPS